MEIIAPYTHLPGEPFPQRAHGCLDGAHTHHAYLGCTEPIVAKNVLEVRTDIERILLSVCA